MYCDIDIKEDRFGFFLRWLADEKKFNEYGIISVVEKPYKYKDLWLEFNQKEYN